MNKLEMTETIVQAKHAKGMSWEQVAHSIGMSPAWTASACLGQNSMPKEYADKLCSILDLPAQVADALQECPTKTWDKTVPTDPLIYRFYEVMGVYGTTIKALIHEKFGDGIMSAIDFTLHVDKVEDPKGDRVKVTMNGKYLPYKSW